LRAILELAQLRKNPARPVKRLGVQPKELKLPEASQFNALLESIATAGGRTIEALRIRECSSCPHHVGASVGEIVRSGTILAGVALGTFKPGSNTYGLLLLNGSSVVSSDLPTNLVRVVRYNVVQEQANDSWSAMYPGASIRTGTNAASPASVFSFTEWSVPAVEPVHVLGTGYTEGRFRFNHCQFSGSQFNSYTPECHFTNCLFQRVNAL
jgi:hypothetical protein